MQLFIKSCIALYNAVGARIFNSNFPTSLTMFSLCSPLDFHPNMRIFHTIEFSTIELYNGIRSSVMEEDTNKTIKLEKILDEV